MTIIYCDGAGWNGQISEHCILKEGHQPKRTTTTQQKTNNEMEYQAVIEALKIATKNDTIITDSQLVVNQLTQNWKVNAQNLKQLHQTAQKLLQITEATLKWQPRNTNKAGKILENKG